MPEDIKKEEEKTTTTQSKITNPKELSEALLNILLPKKEKTLSYEEVASIIVTSADEFEKHVDKDKTSPLNKENLTKASPHFAYKVTLYSLLTNMLASFAYHASPKEAEKISELLKK